MLRGSSLIVLVLPVVSVCIGSSAFAAVGLAGTLDWNGGSNSAWDTATSPNWYNVSTGSLDDFYAGDNVIFNDTPGTATTVTINQTVMPGSLTVSNTNANYTFTGSGSIAGAASLVKSGSGMLSFAVVNTYSGSTTVNGGTLQLNAANGGNGALASPTVTVNSGGVLALNAADVLGYMSSREALIINGGTVSDTMPAGRVTLQNAVTMTGGLLTGTGTGDYGGVYSFNSANGFNATSDAAGRPAIVNASSISAEGNNSLNFNVTRGAASPAADLTVLSSIVPFNGERNGITKIGNGILALTGSNTFIGPTAISGGTLLLGNGGTTGTLLSSGSIDDNGTLGFNRSNAVVQGADFGALIGGSGGVAQLGTGILMLSASNTYSGPTTVAGGTLSASRLANPGGASSIGQASADSASLVISNGSVFQYTGTSVSISRGFTVGPGGANINVAAGTKLQLAGTPVLNATLTKIGGGTLQLISYGGSTVSGSGSIIVDQGTLAFSSSYFGVSPFGYRTLNIQVNPNGNLNILAPHALGGDNVDGGTSWGVVRILGGVMTLSREQYISGGTVNSFGRLILQGGTINNAGAGELRATSNTSCVSTLASGQPSTINVPMTAQYGPYVFDVANGLAITDLLLAGNLSSSSGSYGITKINSGELVLTGSNSYTTTTISGGTLQVGAGGATGTLGTGTITDNSVLSFARNDNYSVANVIGGSGSIVQLGPGGLVLTATNSFSGGVTVAGGTLILASKGTVVDGSNLTIGDATPFTAAPFVPIAVKEVSGASSVPEPGTQLIVLAALGVAAVCQFVRPRRSQRL